ncbi:MAG: hypothetical protein K0U75_10565 [Actinomycetia bacterium]|nr:hypothetical protein [Actinomycetes bacterium]MCH9761082.1 hypothetical protein [Actinomycetes bacterium]
MLVAAVLCLGAAVATVVQGVWSLTRPPSADYVRRVLRGVAPVQLAAGAMLAAGGLVAMSASPPTSVVVLTVCVVGAVGTVAAGCWQSATAVLREQRNRPPDGEAAGCGGACATCTLSCGSDEESVTAEVDRMGR